MECEFLYQVRRAPLLEARHQGVDDRIDHRLAPLRDYVRQESLLEYLAETRMLRSIHGGNAAAETDADVTQVSPVGKGLDLAQRLIDLVVTHDGEVLHVTTGDVGRLAHEHSVVERVYRSLTPQLGERAVGIGAVAEHRLIGDEGIESRIIEVFEVSDCVHKASEAFSNSAASPCPPPIHMVSRP